MWVVMLLARASEVVTQPVTVAAVVAPGAVIENVASTPVKRYSPQVLSNGVP